MTTEQCNTNPPPTETATKSINKKLTTEQLLELANKHNIDPVSLQAVINVECGNRGGFLPSGKAVILFERHVFYRLLGKIKWFSKRKHFAKVYPSLCNRNGGGYNSHKGDQYQRLGIASSLVDSEELKQVALMSCSWGLGQIMGYHFDKLGYASIQEFVDYMNESEYQQLDAMIRFLKINNLIEPLNNQRWAIFARAYNGKSYRKNKYAKKLANAYHEFKKLV